MTVPRSDFPAPAAAPDTTVLVRVTHAEAVGAVLKVAGLSVLERALRQLGRARGVRAVLATDGAVPIPSSLPPNVDVRHVGGGGGGGAADEIEALRLQIGASAVLGADEVRVKNDPLQKGLRVTDEASRRRAEDAIFADLLRGDLGVVARHLNKKISFRITRYILCRLPVTPNQVTLGAAVIGLFGCFLIAQGTYAAAIGGLLLAQLQSILDGCDGELARVRFQQTAIGEWLDTLVDDFLNVSVVASLGVGLWRAGLGWPAVAGAAAACSMFLVYNAVSYSELVRQGQGGELIKIRWKLVRGQNLKSMWNETGGGGGGGGGGLRAKATLALLALGRRDTFVFAWLLLAIFNLLPIALLWAVVAALICFVTAVAQIVLPGDRRTD